MLQFYMVFLIGLLALMAGIILYIWAVRSKGPGVLFAQVFGIIMIVLSTLTMAGSVFYAVNHPQQASLRGAGVGEVRNLQKHLGERAGGRPAPGNSAAVAAPSRVTPVVAPNRSLNRELRRGGIYHKNH